jgi:hypothetical protein
MDSFARLGFGELFFNQALNAKALGLGFGFGLLGFA